jgi:AraC-like DNA-binding protein
MTCVPYAAILDHIHRNVSRRVGVDELAAIARISVFELCRAFRREHATSPYRLVLEVRVRYASAMLRAGVRIADAAARTGFADQSHFTRHFKRLTGMTPRQYMASPRNVAHPGASAQARIPERWL